MTGAKAPFFNNAEVYMTEEKLQRTESWHKQRVGKITGSIVGAVLGLNKNKTPG